MRKLLNFTFVFSFLITLLLIPSSHAIWQADGVAVCDATGDQDAMNMTSDGAGGAILTWEDRRGYPDIYAQRIDPFGNALWTPNGVVICGASYAQYGPQIISDGAGGAIIAWYDGRPHPNRDVYAQRVDPNGNPLWTADGEAICTAAENQTTVRITTDGAKGAIIVWIDERSGTAMPKDVYVQRVDSLGNALWTADGVAVCTNSFNQDFPCIASDGAGGAYIAWIDYRAGYHIYAQRVDANGNTLWAADGITISTASKEKYDIEIMSDGQGGAIIAWCDNRTWYDLYAQRVDGDGNTQWTANGTGVCISPQQQRYPQMIPDGSGGAIIAWRDNRYGEMDIFARHINGAGDTLWIDNGVPICTHSGHQHDPHITTDNVGGAIIAWYDMRVPNPDIYTQRIDQNGTALWTANGVALCTADQNQTYPRIVSDGAAGAIIAWVDMRNYLLTDEDIYIDSVNGAGIPKVPALLENYFTKVLESGIAIHWKLTEAGDDMRFFIHRAEMPDEIFRELSSRDITGNGLSYTYTDTDCNAGKTYRYRVDVSDESGRRFLFETDAITVPAVTLILEQNYPNPFNPRTVIRFHQPADAHVNLSVYDLGGRHVVTLVNEERSQGPNEVEWDGKDANGNAVGSGVYLYRLKSGNTTLCKKMVLLK